MDEADRIVENADFSSQRHFETVQHWERWRDWLGLPSTALAALTSAAAFTQFFGSGVAAGIAALFVTVLTAVNTYLNPSQRAEQHRVAGNAYLALRNEASRLKNIHAKREGMSDSDLLERIEALGKQVDQLNGESPQTPGWAYEKAKKNIERGQTRNRVDERQVQD